MYWKNRLFLLLLACLPWAMPAQPPGQPGPDLKGVKPLGYKGSGSGNTWAVVVGISDYQDVKIPDLRFADKDAEAFAQFLRSPAGGGLNADHLKLLLNNQATLGNFTTELGWLIDTCTAGDHIIIYFSGHGDVERKIIDEPGYLLLWDSPFNIYINGALSVEDLGKVVRTLSMRKGGKVTVITDACHAGLLSGSALNGPGNTTSSLSIQFANEVKILSCQSDEFSLEGDQWGGGRGLFSYYLTDALYGLADANKDLSVTLLEAGRYLEDHVIPEAAPHKQTPITAGNKTEEVARVDTTLLRHLQQYKAGELAQFNPAQGKTFEQEVFARADSNIRNAYTQYKLALAERRLLEPEGNCADTYFQQLMAVEALAPLRGFLKRNYSAELQNEAQQAVNALMRVNVQEVTKGNYERAQQYGNFPRLLERAAELLGHDHYMYKPLKARQSMFEGLLLYLGSYVSSDPASGLPALEKYREALKFEPYNPLTHYYISNCFAQRLNEPDSAFVHTEIAVRYAQTWALPYAYLAYNFIKRYHRFEEAKALLDQAMSIDSNSVVVWTGYISFYYYQHDYAATIAAAGKVIQLDSTNALAWTNLGVSQLQLRRYEEAERSLKHAAGVNPRQFTSRYALGCLYAVTGRKKEAEAMFLVAVQLNPTNLPSRDSLAMLYMDQNRLEEAEVQLLEMARLDPAAPHTWYRLACIAAAKSQTGRALEYLEKSIQLPPRGDDETRIEPGFLKKEPRLATLRQSERYQAMMKKFFPGE